MRAAESSATTFQEFHRLAAALYAQNRLGDALAVCLQAANRYSNLDVAHYNVGIIYTSMGRHTDARNAYTTALQLNPRNHAAHAGLADAYSNLGDEQAALRHFQTSMALNPCERVQCTGDSAPIRVLQIASAISTHVNANTGKLFDPSAFEATTICLEFWDAARGLPEHDVVFNIISDADTAGPALQNCEQLLQLTNARVLNHPHKIRGTGRTDVAARLGGIEGLCVPRSVPLTKAELAARGEDVLTEHGLHFPLLLRAPGYHNGRYFVLVPSPESLANCLCDLPGENLLALEWVDTRASDGAFWKYRVMMIGGALYALHLAIADDWNVHYATANMQEHPKRREAEACFLKDFRAFLGSSAVTALERVCAELQLDYGGIDFGLDADGRVVVFEANATMAVLDPPSDECFAYRQANVNLIRSALQDAFRRAASAAVSTAP